MLIISFLKKLIVFIMIAVAIVSVCSPVSAAVPQENPDTAPVIFSGVSFFQFYSNVLDSVLAKNQTAIAADVQVSPYANVPPSVTDSFSNFLSAAGNLCGRILGLDDSISDIEMLLAESRFTEAAPVKSAALKNLAAAEENLNTIEQAVGIAGNQFNIQNTAGDSSSQAYAVVLDDIIRIKNFLDLYQSLLQEQQKEILNERMLPSSDITINITPKSAYVGDTVNVGGTLSANGQPLGNRNIEILLNGSQYLTLTTDSQGNYFSPLQVPYRYVSEIQIQSLYYPQTGDVGNYDLALSPSISLKILFYSALLTIDTDTNVYPGRDISIIGQFNYGSSPIADNRKIEISLDNIPFIESEVSATFTKTISLPADTAIGNHLITVSVTAIGRYAPVAANAILTVIKVIPVLLTSDLPFVVFIPGSFNVHGKLNSEIGPLTQVPIVMTFEGKQLNVVSSDDGTFRATVRSNMGFGLLGSQSLEFTVMPVEPWQINLTVSHRVMTVYTVNCGVFFLILALLGIILPRRLNFRIRPPAKQKLPQSVVMTQSAFSATVASNVAENNSNDFDFSDRNAPAGRLFYWYRIVIRLVQKVSGLLLQPNQTLREYIDDTGKITGAAGKTILEFTRLIEKVVYSPHQVTEDEVNNGEQLANKIRESLGK